MITPINKCKDELRQQVRKRLDGMAPQQREAASREVCSRLRQRTVWRPAGSVLLFAPLPIEPDIWPLLEDALLAGKTVALPRFSVATQSYVACEVRNLETDLQSGKFGIREPGVSCPEISMNRLDLVLVPGVAFDARGGRLGRGKGFYDRLLAAVNGTKCGVAFDEQIVDAVPVGPLDVRVNCIMTPTRWIET
jgi:5-formyltetrahydrofolate cyclo-ligase